jgi:hypothetical protein
MKNFEEILGAIHQAKESKPELAELTTDSKVSVWGNMIWIVAFVIDLLRQMFETHKKEIDTLIASKKLHNGIWIRNQLLNFQYGYTLIPGTDVWKNGNATPDEVEASKIIKYAAVTESVDEKRVICKIATEEGEKLQPLTATHIEAIAEWLSQIKATGIPYTIINYKPDLLLLQLRIFRNPLLLDQNGVHRITGKEPVKEALKEFMKELPFNGELRLQELANKLEQAEGVSLVQIDSAQSCWIDPATNNYGNYVEIDVRKIPESGYFELENFDGISYGI